MLAKIWDHAATSIIVEEAGGRFTDHWGGKRLDTRTALYSNGRRHDNVLAAPGAIDQELEAHSDPGSQGGVTRLGKEINSTPFPLRS